MAKFSKSLVWYKVPEGSIYGSYFWKHQNFLTVWDRWKEALIATSSIRSSVSIEHRLATDTDTDRQTDRQTDGHIAIASSRACIASRMQKAMSRETASRPEDRTKSGTKHVLARFTCIPNGSYNNFRFCTVGLQFTISYRLNVDSKLSLLAIWNRFYVSFSQLFDFIYAYTFSTLFRFRSNVMQITKSDPQNNCHRQNTALDRTTDMSSEP